MIVRLEWRDFWFFPFFFAFPVLAWFQACQFGRFAFGSHTPSPHSWERGHTHTKTRTTAPDSFLVAHRCISCPLVDRTIYGRCHPADLLTHCQEPGKGWYLTLVNNCFSFFLPYRISIALCRCHLPASCSLQDASVAAVSIFNRWWIPDLQVFFTPLLFKEV